MDSQIAKALQGTKSGGWVNIPGPGHSSADRSLGIIFHRDAPDGFLLHSLAGDDLIDCRRYVIALLSGNAIPTPEPTDALKTDGAKRIRAALKIWNEALPPGRSLVATYLAARRCPLPVQMVDGSVLRFHPKCRFGSHSFPAMVALMRDVITGEPTGVHRTALMDDGSSKRIMPDDMPAKRMLGRAKGAVVMLNHPAPRMGIAEGIETALSASQIFGIPVWSLMSADGIAACPVIPGVKHLTIFADQDQAGLAAATKCAARYERAGIEGEIRYPSTGDWNSYLTETVHD
jgi:putative DNA primase/helicase